MSRSSMTCTEVVWAVCGHPRYADFRAMAAARTLAASSVLSPTGNVRDVSLHRGR